MTLSWGGIVSQLGQYLPPPSPSGGGCKNITEQQQLSINGSVNEWLL